MQKKWLIRLIDAETEFIISHYLTENPEQQLKTFYFCKEHDISIYLPRELNTDKYKNKESGLIADIEVHFGDSIYFCTIDIWLEEIY